MKIRRIALRSLVAVPLVAAGGVGVAAYLPKLVRDRVVKEVQARTGLSARLGDVSVGLSGVTLETISIGDEGGPRMEAREVELGANAIVAAFRGASSVRSVVVRGLHVDLPMQAESTRALLARFAKRRAQGGDGEREASGSARSYHVESLSLSVTDQRGKLASIEGASLSRDADGVSARVARASLGAAPESLLQAEGIELRGATASGLQLDKLSVRSAVATLAAPPAPEPAPTGADGDVDAEAPAPAPAAAPEEIARRSTLRRALAALHSVTDRADSATKSGGTPAAGGVTGVPVLDRLTPAARITVKKGVVRAADGVPILEGLSASVSAAGAEQLAFKGEGSAAGGGAIGWDMQLWPGELRADGDVELRALPLSLVAPFLPSIPWHEPEKGRVDAQLVINTETVQRIAVSGEATITDAAIAAARVAGAPVDGMTLTVNGRGHWLPTDKRLEIADAEVALGKAAANVKGALEWTRAHYLIDIEAKLPPTPCTDALHAIPDALLGDLSLASWSGKIGGMVRAKLDSRDLDAGELEVEIDDRCQFVTVPAMADLRRFRMPFSHSVLEPDGSVFEMETGPGTPAWTYLEDVSPFFVHAVLAHEDARFFSHEGFSLPHIRNALVRNLKAGRYVVGASTITMQLVKNIFLHREKTLARKVQEVLLTWWLERVMDKRDILELYVNVIEYGPGVYGIRNGARHYFNRLPSQLSPAESVYLSTILPNPKIFYGAFERGSLSSGRVDKMKKIFARMRARSWYSPEAVDYGLQELADFKFVPEGTVTAAREIPGTTAPLPYLRAYRTDWNWDVPEDALGEEAPPPVPDAAPLVAP